MHELCALAEANRERERERETAEGGTPHTPGKGERMRGDGGPILARKKRDFRCFLRFIETDF